MLMAVCAAAAVTMTRAACVDVSNPSNYCFLNSTVQCLRHTPGFAALVGACYQQQPQQQQPCPGPSHTQATDRALERCGAVRGVISESNGCTGRAVCGSLRTHARSCGAAS
jgi:hypothetical protein